MGKLLTSSISSVVARYGASGAKLSHLQLAILIIKSPLHPADFKFNKENIFQSLKSVLLKKFHCNDE